MSPLRPGPGIRNAVLDALGVLVPVSCASCGAPDRGVCAACRSALAPAPVAASRPGAGVEAWAGLTYAGAAARAIRAFKDEGRTDVAASLAPAMRAALAAACGAAGHGAELELTTVPSTAAARRERGYEPVALLVRHAGFRTARVLRARDRADQAGLDRSARRANADGAFTPVRRLDGRRFVLVDDVVTTGSTLAAAARAIRSAGGSVDAVAVLAQTPLRIPVDHLNT